MARPYLIAFIMMIGLSEPGGILRAQDCRDDHLEREYSVRDELPNFSFKLSQNQEVRVAFLGSSITAQPGWRKYAMEWLKGAFPKSVFTEINAAIGVTASDFEAYRLSDQVLRFGPDLIFIEFAVNDSKKTKETMLKAMEGMVRQVHMHDPHIDMCFVYTIKDAYLEDEIKGMLPTSKQAMEEIADYYGISTINFGAEIADLVCREQLIFEGTLEQDAEMVFNRDGVHPYIETGHLLYFSILKRNLTKALSQAQSIYRHHIRPPLFDDHFIHTKMIDLAEVNKDDQWQLIKCAGQTSLNKFSEMLPYLWHTNRTNSILTFRFRGTSVGIYDIVGPSSIQSITLEIDGVARKVPRFDAYCSYHRMGYFLVDNLEDTAHDVRLNVNAEPFNKGAILSKRGRKIDDPIA
ncbi:MAG: SGNH/GDSL hydrolase family protein [Saprospiraceae bacterium]|nr:SGNH/GDSL hydrolase family protein [Saprospiraceae bacterium]